MIKKIKNLFPNLKFLQDLNLSDSENMICFLDNIFVKDLSSISDSFVESINTVENLININLEKSHSLPFNIFFIGSQKNNKNFKLNINLADSVNLDCYIFIIDSSMSDLSGKINFVIGNFANIKTRILYINNYSSKYDIDLVTEHIASNSNSDLLVKGVLDKDSDVNFNMKIVINKFLKSVYSSELHRVLKLSPTATIKSIPAIVCNTEDSIIKHGFALSGFDKDQIYFLKSRGINSIDSELLLKDAFINLKS